MVCAHQNKTKYAAFNSSVFFTCADCGLVFNSGTAFVPESLYEDYYKNEVGGRFGAGVELVVRLMRFFRAFKMYTISSKAKTILDVGCGRGFMLFFLKNYFHYEKAIGTQISRPAIEFARRRLLLDIRDKDLPEINFEADSFEIVSMLHVLEHVKNPEEYVREIHRILKPGGKFVVEVPNFSSWTRKMTGRYWLSLDLKYHLTFFSPETLSALLKKYGFKIRQTNTFSLEYSTFTSTQSLVNLMTGTENLFFRWIQSEKVGPWVWFHPALFAIISPVCFLINLLLYFSKKGERTGSFQIKYSYVLFFASKRA